MRSGRTAKADVVLGKALRVLPETELLQPVGDLLHRGSAPDYRASSARIGQTTRQIPSAVDAPARWQTAEDLSRALRYRCPPLRGPPMRQTDDRSQGVVLAETALAALAGAKHTRFDGNVAGVRAGGSAPSARS